MVETDLLASVPGVAVGRLAGLAGDGSPLVTLDPAGEAPPRAARTTVALGFEDVGAELVLVFEAGDPTRPIVVGRLRGPAPAVARVDLVRDGERLVLEADREIVLRCGRASITLTRGGKVLIRGAYLSSRSSGVNRIQGASVQLN
jgi:hypothetical protein